MPKMIERREQLRDLCKRVVANPNKVDGNIADALRSATLKYAHLVCDDPERVLKGLCTSDGELGCLVREAVAIVSKELDDRERSSSTGAAYPRDRWYLDLLRDPDDDIDEDDREDADDDDDVEKQTDHHASVVADLLVESGRFTDRPEALHHLLHKPGGRALLASLHKAAKTEKEKPTMTSLHDVAKTHGVDGVVQIAKIITEEQRGFQVTEEEFVKLIDIAARIDHPELGGRALERVYERNPVLAKAITVIKARLAEQPLSGGMPVQVVGGEDARAVNDPSVAMDAYNELVRIGAERWSHLLPAAQFAKAFELNPELARKAHQRPVAPPGGVYPMPR
jgi:hypothetical protein